MIYIIYVYREHEREREKVPIKIGYDNIKWGWKRGSNFIYFLRGFHSELRYR